jgi:hypothetical protein
MNLVSRLAKIEGLIKSKQSEKGVIVLYNEYGKLIDGVVVKMPTVEAEGLARLPDGSEMPIIFDPDWDGMVDVWIFNSSDDKFEFMDERPADAEPLPSIEGKLFMRYSNCKIVTIIPATREMV